MMTEYKITEAHKTCPFCKNDDLVMSRLDACPPTFYAVGCPRCQAGGPLGTTPEMALELWNDR